MAEQITVIEVGPRDGLQNQPAQIDTAGKLALIDGLAGAGLRAFEAASFVNPKAVPQMADGDAVMQAVRAKYPDLHMMGMVFNDRGYDRALAAGARSIVTALAMSETMSQKNVGMGMDRAAEMTQRLISRAQRDGIRVRVALAVAWVCPYEGAVPQDRVIWHAERVIESGIQELCIADTIGQAHPAEVGTLSAALVEQFGAERIALHLHDTQALGLANAAAGMAAGVRRFDSSIGGLGGCPFAPGAAGNLATEDLVFMAHKMGFETGVAFESLWHSVKLAANLTGRHTGGRISQWWESYCRQQEEDG